MNMGSLSSHAQNRVPPAAPGECCSPTEEGIQPIGFALNKTLNNCVRVLVQPTPNLNSRSEEVNVLRVYQRGVVFAFDGGSGR